MDATVAICTYGAAEWKDLAENRAAPSAAYQASVLLVHDDDLTTARNRALSLVQTEYVIFLDADDLIPPGYVEAMSRGTADVRAPRALYREGRKDPGKIWQPRVVGHTHDCTAECLSEGNWVMIGAAVRTELLREVGGFRDWPLWEDYDLWLRCRSVGASFELIRDAIYIAHVDPGSRNRGAVDRETQLRVYDEIRAANGIGITA